MLQHITSNYIYICIYTYIMYDSFSHSYVNTAAFFHSTVQHHIIKLCFSVLWKYESVTLHVATHTHTCTYNYMHVVALDGLF